MSAHDKGHSLRPLLPKPGKHHSPRQHGQGSAASLSPRTSFQGHYAQPMDISDGAQAPPPPRRSMLPAVHDATPRDREVQSMPMMRPPRRQETPYM